MEHPEDIALKELNTQHAKVMDAVSAIEEKRIEAEDRMAELQRSLPDAVLKAAMGEVPADEPRKMRREMQELRETIEDAELVLEPLRRAESRYAGESQKISRRVGYRRDYEGLKSKVTEAGHATWSDTTTLRDLCLTLNGNHDDADAFLANLKPAAA